METSEKSWPRRILGWLCGLLLVGAVALFVGVTLLPRVFGIELRTVVSGSMEPAISQGSLVVGVPANTSDLKQGDIIIFRAPDGSGRVITHRIAAVHDDTGSRTFETRGDANNTSDPWRVAQSAVLGKVRGDIPKAGSVVEKIRSRAGFLLLMVLPALIVLAGEASVWRRFLRERQAPVEAAAPEAQAYPVVVADRKREARGKPSPFLAAAVVLIIMCVAVTGVMYFIAPRPESHDETARVSAETQSVATHSQTLADGEAFGGDIQILRNAEDLRLRDPSTPVEDRTTALRQMLLVNTNRFDALTLVDLTGNALAATDPSLPFAADSSAYQDALRTQGAAASDIHVSDGGAARWIEFAAPVLGFDGKMQAVLVARTQPPRLWANTLATSIDGSRNVVLDRDGHYVAGVADETLGTTAGIVPGDGVQALTLAGTQTLCAVRPIGSDTPLDHGWSVASCLPASLLGAPVADHETQFAINSVAVALVAFSMVLLLLAFLLGAPEPRVARPQVGVGLKAIEARLLAQREARDLS